MNENPINIDDIIWSNIYFNWSQQKCGFGQLSIEKNEEGKLICSNECMSREWVRKALHSLADHLADTVILDSGKNNENTYG